MALWPHCSLPKKLFPLFLLQRWLVNNNSPWLELGPNQLGPRDAQPCPMFLSFVSYQIHKTKSLKNINVILTYSRPLMLQVFLEHQRGNTSPSSRLVSNPNFAQPGVPWGNIRHLSKFPEGWEENDSHCECRSMLPSQPRVCIGWMRSRRYLDSELGVSQSPHAWLPPGVTRAEVSLLCHEHRRNSPDHCFPDATWRQVYW